MKIEAIVPAAGSGRRLSRKGEKKPFIRINSKPLFIHTLAALNKSREIQSIILVVAKKFIGKTNLLISKYKIKNIKRVVPGGRIRTISVSNGLKHLDKDTDLVLVHDGVRPMVDKATLSRSIKAARKYGASCCLVPVKPTVKVVKNEYILKTLDRKKLFDTQTPQVFRKDIILKAYKNSRGTATDDSSLVERLGYKVRMVPGSYRNIKVTTEEDLLLAERLLK